MNDLKKDIERRVAFIKDLLQKSGAKGVIFGNSGGKDCALVGILCRMATENVLGVIMPCESRRNYEEDRRDGEEVAKKFGLQSCVVDIGDIKSAFRGALAGENLGGLVGANINPRIRMTVLYAMAQARGYLVAGTGNRSERYMGYYTKWGDGACDFNPISDLTVQEVYAYLEALDAPRAVIEKAPSAALYEGQTDEQEMGVTYRAIDTYLLGGEIDPKDKEIIDRYHARSEHKRTGTVFYKRVDEA